jgi:hypothetical protein
VATRVSMSTILPPTMTVHTPQLVIPLLAPGAGGDR